MIEGNFCKILETELSCVEYLKRKMPATIPHTFSSSKATSYFRRLSKHTLRRSENITEAVRTRTRIEVFGFGIVYSHFRNGSFELA